MQQIQRVRRPRKRERHRPFGALRNLAGREGQKRARAGPGRRCGRTHSLIRKQVFGVAYTQENKLQYHISSLSEMMARTHGKTRAVPLRSSISASASPGAPREVRGRQVSSCLSPPTFTYLHHPPQQPLPCFLRRPPRPWATVALADASVALGPEPRTTSRDSESCLQSKRHGQTIGGRTGPPYSIQDTVRTGSPARGWRST